jgi:hypothetical protein
MSTAAITRVAMTMVPVPSPNTVGLVDHLFHQIADVLRHGLHEAEGFLQNVSHDVGDRNAKIVRNPPDVFRERFGNPCVEHPLLSPAVPAAAAALTTMGFRLRFLRPFGLRRFRCRTSLVGTAGLSRGVGVL